MIDKKKIFDCPSPTPVGCLRLHIFLMIIYWSKPKVILTNYISFESCCPNYFWIYINIFKIMEVYGAEHLNNKWKSRVPVYHLVEKFGTASAKSFEISTLNLAQNLFRWLALIFVKIWR